MSRAWVQVAIFNFYYINKLVCLFAYMVYVELVKSSHHDKCSLTELEEGFARRVANVFKCENWWAHRHTCMLYSTTIIPWSNMTIENSGMLFKKMNKMQTHIHRHNGKQWAKQAGKQTDWQICRQIQWVKHGNLSIKRLHFQMPDINFNFEFYLCQVFLFNAHKQEQKPEPEHMHNKLI